MTRIYGISNCDTVRKAKTWLQQEGIDYQFVDFRKDGLTLDQVQRWCDAVGIDNLLNRRGTTWRKLDESVKQITDQQQLQQLLVDHPALIKRPVLERGNHTSVGFNADSWKQIFA